MKNWWSCLLFNTFAKQMSKFRVKKRRIRILETSVSDLDPNPCGSVLKWLPWIRIRPVVQFINFFQYKFAKYFDIFNTGMSLLLFFLFLDQEHFFTDSCYESKKSPINQKKFDFLTSWEKAGSGSGSASRWRAVSGSASKWCGSATLG